MPCAGRFLHGPCLLLQSWLTHPVAFLTLPRVSLPSSVKLTPLFKAGVCGFLPDRPVRSSREDAASVEVCFVFPVCSRLSVSGVSQYSTMHRCAPPPHRSLPVVCPHKPLHTVFPHTGLRDTKGSGRGSGWRAS